MSHSFLEFSGKTSQSGARLHQSVNSYIWQQENAVKLATHFIEIIKQLSQVNSLRSLLPWIENETVTHDM